jgi:hypothetical protein
MSYARSHSLAAGLALALVACSERMPGDTAQDTTTGTASDVTTTAEPPVTSFNPTTSTAPTSSDSNSGDATTEPAPTTGETPTTGPAPTTGDATTSTTGDATSTTCEPASSTGETTGGADALVLDPRTLVFFDLPIGSIRYAVGGFDPDAQTCVSIIFFDPGEQQHCDDFQTGDNSGFPYVFIVPNSAPPCMEWDYAGNVQLDAASGCMQLTNPFPAEIAIDMELSVSGAPFTGTISVASE